jgi:putative DNA methylase
VLDAIVGAGFSIMAVQPVKSEMSVATPKTQASRPINLDMIIVCRKRRQSDGSLAIESTVSTVLSEAAAAARQQVVRFAEAGRQLGYGDVRVILAGHVVRLLSNQASAEEARRLLALIEDYLEATAARLHAEPIVPRAEAGQLSFFALDGARRT